MQRNSERLLYGVQIVGVRRYAPANAFLDLAQIRDSRIGFHSHDQIARRLDIRDQAQLFPWPFGIFSEAMGSLVSPPEVLGTCRTKIQARIRLRWIIWIAGSRNGRSRNEAGGTLSTGTSSAGC